MVELHVFSKLLYLKNPKNLNLVRALQKLNLNKISRASIFYTLCFQETMQNVPHFGQQNANHKFAFERTALFVNGCILNM